MILLSKYSKYISLVIFGFVIFSYSSVANAATLTCTFMSETEVSKSGEWLKSSVDFEEMWALFGMEGLVLPLNNTLLGKLDSQQPFLAGHINLGNVYIMGGDYGVEGMVIEVEGDVISMYSGMCDVSFG
tara:strand:+ start:220 stop:606 length:387 start_codon:yes stop_codon:yes gene_type:complete